MDAKKDRDRQWVTYPKELPYEHARPYAPESFECGSGCVNGLNAFAENMAFMRGSGSRLDEALKAEALEQINALRQEMALHWNSVFVAYSVGSGITVAQPSTVSEKLGEIRDAFGISTAALAAVLRAARASVYNWLENEAPKPAFQARIDTMSSIASDWLKRNPYHFTPGRLMKQSLGAGPSMLDRLCREQLDLAEIDEGMTDLVALMKKYRERMERAKTPVAAKERQETLERLTGSVTADN